MSGETFNKPVGLADNQALAVDPHDSVWLSASAGTGKTQVLSSRVLRLLLQGDVRPEQLLCLTFTKAGAAEMATRVNSVLARWVRMPDAVLAGELLAIGASASPETQARARTLFTSVLDCPGGGLRIDTIHAFSQWLLAAFPEEAGLIPGTSPMEDRDRDLLAHQVLADLLVEWEERCDAGALAALEALSVRMGPADARGWLMRCAGAHEMWFGPGAWLPPMRGRVEALLGLPEGCDMAKAAEFCTDDAFDIAALQQCIAANLTWGTATGKGSAGHAAEWLAASAPERLEQCGNLVKALFTKDGKVRSLKNLEKFDPDYEEAVERIGASLKQVTDRIALIEMAEWVTPALELGRTFALAWDEAKTREGLIDFDDLIRRAAALLAEPGLGEWIRYKLDRRFDHVLVDEAQDTNAAQWSIIDALTDDFFTGAGQHDNRLRTIFVVGDYKQAIFRFQGTSPQHFDAARKRYRRIMQDRAQNVQQLRQNIPARELADLDLGRSYRTAQEVLTFVDEAIGAVGHKSLGLETLPEPHVGERRPGFVTLWNPVPGRLDDSADEEEDDKPEAEGWVSAPERRMADKIAAQIKQWLTDGFPLVKGEARNAGPGDIMVLVRKRRELAGLIVARLYAAGVPVAGVDRLRLAAPLAVQDLMAALRFAAQPLDDLSLAGLLVSPLFGWSQEDLLEHGYRDKGVKLWHKLKGSSHFKAAAARAMLGDLLARADYETPQALLHWMLIGPWRGRGRLVARLGQEANVPIDELLNAALAFSAAHVPSLHGFIQWFDAGEGDLKREQGEAQGLVRVMTVHGAKGLQSPIVILADATGNPDRSRSSGLDLQEDLPGGGGRKVPWPALSGDAREAGPFNDVYEAEKKAALEEHWRLLYVAMTRAEEALFIGGALEKREKEPSENSWFAKLVPLFDAVPLADENWGWRLERGSKPAPIAVTQQQQDEPSQTILPDWALNPIGAEPRPPRPLAPSSAADEQGADPPLPSAQAELAARRGVLIHALLERLPDVVPEQRAERAAQWLARHAADMDGGERKAITLQALNVLNHPQWADLFSPAALAEVPLAAVVGGQVVAGTADRLLVQPGRVLVADFKTARRPPAALADVPVSTLRQMGAYAAALAVIYPGRTIEAAVLYTQTPQLIAIPADILAAHKPALAPVQETYQP